jgi:hypothetical protein
MFLDNIEITEEQERYCRKWLRQWYKADARLTDTKLFPESYLLRLLKIELNDRCRAHIIRRLESRYNLVRRRRERTEMNEKTRRPLFSLGKAGANND